MATPGTALSPHRRERARGLCWERMYSAMPAPGILRTEDFCATARKMVRRGRLGDSSEMVRDT
jgi:hypothetical protein